MEDKADPLRRGLVLKDALQLGRKAHALRPLEAAAYHQADAGAVLRTLVSMPAATLWHLLDATCLRRTNEKERGCTPLFLASFGMKYFLFC